MYDRSYTFLKDILETPSPSGFEQPVQGVVRSWSSEFADHIQTDVHGNVIASLQPKDPGSAPLRVMFAGHCDQLGLMVEYIDANGYLYFQPIGGWDVAVAIGQRMTVWSKSGPLTGLIARKAPHLLTPEERNKVPQIHELWLDIGVRNKEEASELVQLGDPVTVELGFREMLNGNVTSPAMDDKVGVWVAFEALRLLHQRDRRSAVYAVSTVQEEIGLRGATTSAYSVQPHVGIAIDVTHATDTPGSENKQIGDVKLGGGPVLYRGPNINPHVFAHLEAAAKRAEVPYQVRGANRATGTDANAIQLSRGGVATGLIGIPNRYMHSPVEMVHTDDLINAAILLAEFAASVDETTNWIP
ncbi:MAG: M42 family metallopeptidase [Zavarzinella sp.]